MIRTKWLIFVIATFVIILGAAGFSTAGDVPSIKFSCSAQLYNILQQQTLDAFTQTTGIGVDLTISSSEAALFRLYHSVSDVAGSAERLVFPKGEYGYVESRICQAPIVVITHPDIGVDNLTTEQLRDIFSGKITNWKEVGGNPEEIVVVVPDKSTAAYRNFSKLALKRFDINYSIMTYRSTMVVDVVGYLPGSISFITKSANSRDTVVKILKVDGISYTHADYPYFQIFNLVTRGYPKGVEKEFVDFIRSDKISTMLRDNGITPIEK